MESKSFQLKKKKDYSAEITLNIDDEWHLSV